MRRGGGNYNINHSKEGVTQGEPLDILAYGIGIIPLTKNLKSTYPDVIQPWYADNARALGTLNHMEIYLKR